MGSGSVGAAESFEERFVAASRGLGGVVRVPAAVPLVER